MKTPVFRRRIDVDAVANAAAGKDMNRDDQRAQVLQMWRDGFAAEDAPGSLKLRFTKNLDDLSRAQEQMKRRRPDLLIIMGGDGTIQKTLTGVIDELWDDPEDGPPVVAYKLGTVCYIADTLRLLGHDPLKATRRLIQKIQHGIEPDYVSRQILRINGHYGFMLGVGTPVNFLDQCYRQKPRGMIGAFKAIAKTFLRETIRLLPPFWWMRSRISKKFGASCTLYSGDREILRAEGPHTGIIASSIEQVGLNFQLTYRAIEEVNHFHIILSRLGFWGIARNLPNIRFGWPLFGDAQDAVATKAVLKFEKPVIYTIDGEMYGKETPADSITIEGGPHIKFVTS